MDGIDMLCLMEGIQSQFYIHTIIFDEQDMSRFVHVDFTLCSSPATMSGKTAEAR